MLCSNLTRTLMCVAIVGGFTALSHLARAQDMPADYQAVLKTLDKKGDYKANVLKVNIPRNDPKVTVEAVHYCNKCLVNFLWSPVCCYEERSRFESRRPLPEKL